MTKHTLVRRAQRVLRGIARGEGDAVSLNARMTAHMANAQHAEALRLYERAQHMAEAEADSVSHALCIKACAQLGHFARAKRLHSRLRGAAAWSDDVVVKTALMDLYGRARDVQKAEALFASVAAHVRTTACANAMMSAYCANERLEACLALFEALPAPDCASYAVACTACASGGRVEAGNRIFESLLRGGGRGLELVVGEVWSASSLLHMCGQFGDLARCEHVFAALRRAAPAYLCQIGIWNVMMGAYAANGAVDGAVRVFREMQRDGGIEADGQAYVTLLKACSHGGDVEQARWLWDHEIRIGEESVKRNTLVVSAFVDCRMSCPALPCLGVREQLALVFDVKCRATAVCLRRMT